MKIDYIRSLTVSHMVLEQKLAIEEWENEMILNNNVEHLLFGEYVCENGQSHLWYDITGKQALDVLLSSKEVEYSLLCKIMLAFCSVVCKLESLLLVSNDILMLPECIFVDNRTNEILFCYYPGNEQRLENAAGSLMEYLLTRLDHKDQKAVDTAYALYEQVHKEGYSVEDIRKLLCTLYEKEEKEVTLEGMDEKSFKERYNRKNKDCQKNLEDVYVKQAAVNTVFASKFPDSDKRMVNKMNVSKKRIDLENYIENKRKFFTEWGNNITERWKKLLPRKKKVEETFVFEPEEEPEIKRGKPTVLLSEITEKPIGLLRYEGIGQCKDLKINVLPYIIGSDTACDGYVESNTVSRRHAKITKTEDIYFIEDLNSSNGTFIGGQLLNYKVKMSLSQDEEVKFADEKFKFI